MWAVPVARLGFCPLVVARAPREDAEVDFAFAYLQPKLREQPPGPVSIEPLATWGEAWLGLVPIAPFRKGRWQRCGPLPGFHRSQWPVPPARNSAVNEDEPVEQWGAGAGGELWSIETTADAPTMTLLANTPATREDALRFPRVDVAIAASSFEKALVTRLKGRASGFWDMRLCVNAVSADALRAWREHAERVRSKPPPTPSDWLPAGRKTDRAVKAGAWLGLPLRGGGFGAALLVAKPEKHVRLFSDAVVMSMRRRWDRWPTLAAVRRLRPEDGAAVEQTSMICVRDGRWRVLGYQENFDPNEWAWPRPWHQTPGGQRTGAVLVSMPGGHLEIKIDPALLRLDPQAGRRCAGSASYAAIETDTPRILDGVHPSQTGAPHCSEAIVTPERLAAWRKINAALERAIGAQGAT